MLMSCVNLVALAFKTVRLLPKASKSRHMALTFSDVKGGNTCFFDIFELADVRAKHDKVCFKLLVLPDPTYKELVHIWQLLIQY